MPLPAALLARLQKRGIIRAEEEVIAESYDSHEVSKEKEREDDPSGAPGCPNRYNIYHVCADYCYDYWREGRSEKLLSETYLRKRRRMLAKYPLPEGWVEVYDAGMGRHYYWNQDTDEVCWVSPRHPIAVIGEPAPRVARQLTKKNVDRDEYIHQEKTKSREREATDRREKDAREQQKGRGRGEKGGRKRQKNDDSDSDPEGTKEVSDRDRLKRARRKGIDPMDPSAYGDAIAGSWSSGLHNHDKTGADVTASGPLFQQRPYPAPGAILRQQKKKQDEEDDDED